jgi:membrane dipeptidase
LGFDFFEYISNSTSNSFTEEDYKGTLGLEDITKTNSLITRLSERNFSKEDIDKLTHLNFLALMDKVLR